MRKTLQRQWTTREDERARRIIAAVVDSGGEVVTQDNLSGLTGYPRRVLTNLMPRAVRLSANDYPGNTLAVVRRGDGFHYKLSNNPEDGREAAYYRLRKVYTMLERAAAEVEAVRGLTGLSNVAVVTSVDASIAGLKADLLDAIFADAQAASSGPGATPEPPLT